MRELIFGILMASGGACIVVLLACVAHEAVKLTFLGG